MNVENNIVTPDPDDALGLAGDVFAEPAPATLKDRLMASLASRPAVRLTPAKPVEALKATIDDVDALLGSLSLSEWDAPHALGDLDVKRTVAHLHGADFYLGIKIGAWDGPLPANEADHRATSQAQIDYSAGMSSHDVRIAWKEWSTALVGALDDLAESRLEEPARYNLLEGPLGVVLVGRAFELWTHAEDICRATERPPRPPRPDVVATMTTLGVALVPVGYQRLFGATPWSVRVVLTGAGGGTWNLPLGDGAPSDPAASIVADAVDFCRMIAARIDPADLNCDITGDVSLAGRVLVGASQFAMD